jgi:hypothetical protein
VHRPGYHVDWSYKKQSVEKEQVLVRNERLVTEKIENQVVASKDFEPIVQNDIQLNNVQLSNLSSKDQIIFNTKLDGAQEKLNHLVSIDNSKIIEDDQVVSKPRANGTGRGWAIVIVGLIFALLALVFFLYLGVIGQIFGFIFALAATVILIVGLVFLILGV